MTQDEYKEFTEIDEEIQAGVVLFDRAIRYNELYSIYQKLSKSQQRKLAKGGDVYAT